MKKKINGKWHVYSEAGKHMGGPYSSEAEADHRLAQMEYFKHAKAGKHSLHGKKKR